MKIFFQPSVHDKELTGKYLLTKRQRVLTWNVVPLGIVSTWWKFRAIFRRKTMSYFFIRVIVSSQQWCQPDPKWKKHSVCSPEDLSLGSSKGTYPKGHEIPVFVPFWAKRLACFFCFVGEWVSSLTNKFCYFTVTAIVSFTIHFQWNGCRLRGDFWGYENATREISRSGMTLNNGNAFEHRTACTIPHLVSLVFWWIHLVMAKFHGGTK